MDASHTPTPVGAVTLLCVIGLVSGILLGIFLTPINAFAFLGTLDALFVILIYILVNIACLRFFWRKRREHFNWFRNGLFPVLSTLITIGIFIAAIASPGSGALAAIPFVVGIWLVLGVVLLFAFRSKTS